MVPGERGQIHGTFLFSGPLLCEGELLSMAIPEVFLLMVLWCVFSLFCVYNYVPLVPLGVCSHTWLCATESASGAQQSL